ncbi:MAG: hypothetical protein CMO29_15960 [Tistrella sp.]|nr:hypothetical protein [Tistrella sp.]
MRFIKQIHSPMKRIEHRNVCVLFQDNWDDFSFKTTFIAALFDGDGVRHDLGPLKIMSKGMTSGRVDIPDEFDKLGPDFCSIGSDRDYYVKLSEISAQMKESYLSSIRDCVADPEIWEEFRDEEAMMKSLLRFVSIRDIKVSFPRILAGNAELTPYRFAYHFGVTHDSPETSCAFRVIPGTLPPSNIHVLIGRNGVGKTRLIAGMADTLTENQAANIGLPGRFSFENKEAEADTDFLNIIVVAYSAFDHLNPIAEGTSRTGVGIPYHYVGIKKFADDAATGHVALKSHEDMNTEFCNSLHLMISDENRMERWIRAIQILESDPGIRDLNLSRLHETSNDAVHQEVLGQFNTLSSGHKIVLLTITRLVELVSDRSLVLIDEPETHLHPPLLGSFVRALSDLLVGRNGVAILATHSPVVLQEVPSNCVSVLRRSGDVVRAVRPEIETFAENVGTLTRKVFGLEVENSGYFNLLRENAKGQQFDDVINLFDDKIGAEGRALVRAFICKGKA